MTTHAITSIDDPVFKYYPEWRQGQKQNITLRHVLTHTSGLQDPGNSSDVERSPDAVRLALAAELSDPAGTSGNAAASVSCMNAPCTFAGKMEFELEILCSG